MATNKTTQTANSVTDFINSIADETKRNDSFRMAELIKDQTGFEPKMWGPSIIGFGAYHYKYDSGREGDAPLIGFSPRANALTLYFGSFDRKEELLQKLGKHKTGKGCLYIKSLADVDSEIVKEMVVLSMKRMDSK